MNQSELIEAHAWLVVTTYLMTTVLRKMATQRAVGPFVPQCEDWVLYTECLQQWSVANDVQDTSEQGAVYSIYEASMYWLISNLVTPHKPRERTFKQLVEVVKAHYCPSPSMMAQRYTFNSRTQWEGETLAEFVGELLWLLEHCDFMESLDDMLHDRLVSDI